MDTFVHMADKKWEEILFPSFHFNADFSKY